MGLRNQAERDLAFILEDKDAGFGWPITLTDPQGHTDSALIGFSNDISQTIDPSTGEIVSGRLASVTFRLSTLYRAGFAVPCGVPEGNAKPWLVDVADINGVAGAFKIIDGNPDRSLGIVVCTLEGYTRQ